MLASSATAREFTYDNLLYTWMKLDQHFDYAAYVDCYMKEYRSNVWQQSRNDEFQREEKRAETMALMKQRVADTDVQEPMSVRSFKDFGKYDFEAEKFIFSPLSKTTFFYERNPNYCGLPEQLKVKFSNAELIDGIAMPKADAETFLKTRKQYGNIDRSVALEIDFVIQHRDGDMLVARIFDARVIDETRNKNYTGQVLASYTAARDDAGADTEPSGPLSLFGLNAGGPLADLKASLPPGSVICKPTGGECEIMLETGQTLLAKLDTGGKITALEHHVSVRDKTLDALVDDLKTLYGNPIGDTVKNPKPGGFTAFGQVPAQRGERTLVWRSDDAVLQVTLFFGQGKTIDGVSILNPR